MKLVDRSSETKVTLRGNHNENIFEKVLWLVLELEPRKSLHTVAIKSLKSSEI